MTEETFVYFLINILFARGVYFCGVFKFPEYNAINKILALFQRSVGYASKNQK
jgi:hypothetical protein